MSLNRNARVSRKGEIPGNFVLKWQSSGSRGSKPLVRRPMTACSSCRTAKVKCNGQQECDRCTSRGLVCKYNNSDAADSAQPTDRGSSKEAVTSPVAMPTTTSTEISMDLNVMDSTDQFQVDHGLYEHSFDNMAGWPNETAHQRFIEFDWGNMDPGTNEQAFSLHTQQTPPSLELFDTLPSSAPESLTQATPLFPSPFGSGSLINPPPHKKPSLTSQLFSSSKCQCRENLAVLIPRVNNAMHEKQLDEVFNVTRKVMGGCQDIVDCTSCQITCTDLICIMAVFQQTDTCFEYIANADLDSMIKVKFGGYEVPINDPKLRAMLVMNLIQQATMVLDAISTKGQTMLQALNPPSALAQANIGYLDKVTNDFRNVLRRVADSANDSGSSSMDLLVATSAQSLVR